MSASGGSGAGARRMLLIHGILSNADGWWRLGPDLSAAGYAVTAPDLRGHGGSPPVDDYRLDAYRDDILALGSGWDVVLGHSLGGLVAVACQVAHPGWTSALVLEDPALVMADTEWVRNWLLEDFAGPIDVPTIGSRHPAWAPGDVAAKVEALHRAGPEVVERTLAAIGEIDARPWLSELGVPTLLVGADPAVGATVSAADGEAAARLPGVDYVMIPGGEHSIHRNRYEAFHDVLMGWLDRVSPG
jgi:pimeloyl-ACP methyl ester carboxylesterase